MSEKLVNKVQNSYLNPKAKAIFAGSVLACLSYLACPPSALADYAPQVKNLLYDASRYYDQGQYNSARSAYNAAISLEPKCPHAYNGLGLCAMRERKISESNGYYESAIKLNPNYYDALYNLANNYYEANAFADSISCYLRALKVTEQEGKPLDPDLLVSLANVYRDRAGSLSGLPKQEDTARALDFYQRALKLKPDHKKAHGQIGKLYFDQGQLAAAERELRMAVSVNPKYAYAYFQLGMLYRQKRELPAALVAFHNSIKNETIDRYKQETEKEILAMGIPADIWEQFAIAFEELSMGNYDLAGSEFQSASGKQTRMRAAAFNNYGFSQMRAGNTASAIDAFNSAIKISPHGMSESYYNLAQAYLKMNRLDESEAALKQCLEEAKGNHFLAHNCLGVVLKLKGKLKEALNHYNLALLQSGDGLRVVQFNRAVLFEQLGQKKEAAQAYAKYIQGAPTGVNAGIAKERLSKLN